MNRYQKCYLAIIKNPATWFGEAARVVFLITDNQQFAK